MRRKRFLAVLTVFLLVVLLAACGHTDVADSEQTSSVPDSGQTSSVPDVSSEEPFPITMQYIVGTQGDDFSKVEAAISDLAEEELNMTVQLIPCSFGNYEQQQKLMLSSGEPLDVFIMGGQNAYSYISSGYLVDMSPLIDEYGQGILEQLGESIGKAMTIDGFQFAVPPFMEYSNPGGVNMRTDILEECNIDVSKIESFQDLTDVYMTVSQKYPDMDMVVSDFTNAVSLDYRNRLTDNLGVLLNEEDSTTVTNWYESSKYKELADLVRSWYTAGYVKKDLATSTETSESMIKAGNAFSYFCCQKPNTAQEKASQTGYDMTCMILTPLYASGPQGFGFAIASNTEDATKAMQFINWTYTSPGFMNLINWGIEGENYVFVDEENGIIGFPEGQNIQSCKYHQDLGFALPNQSIGYLWEGNSPDIWEKYKEFNASAKETVAFGFMYDPSSITNEIAACSAIKEKYEKAISTGSVDPDEYIPKFNEELYAAGLQKIMDEKQSQLDAWFENKE